MIKKWSMDWKDLNIKIYSAWWRNKTYFIFWIGMIPHTIFFYDLDEWLGGTRFFIFSVAYVLLLRLIAGVVGRL